MTTSTISIEALRKEIDDSTTRNRLISLPSQETGMFLHFEISAREIRQSLETDRRFEIGVEPFVTKDGIQQTHTQCTKLNQVAKTLEREQGLRPLMVGIGLVEWNDGKTDRMAPMSLAPVKIKFENGKAYIQLDGGIVLNDLLLSKVGLTAEMLPDDPLDYRVPGTGSIKVIEDLAIMGTFTDARLKMARRLEPNYNPRIVKNPLVGRLLTQKQGESEPIKISESLKQIKIPMTLDDSQALCLAMAASGQDVLVIGPPGTGKTQVLSSLIFSESAKGKSFLFLSERPGPFHSVWNRLKEADIHTKVLNLHGEYATSKAVSLSLNVPMHRTIIDMLRSLRKSQRPQVIMTTPACYASHVPEEWAFDYLIIDEASQMPLSAAIGAVSAANQIVICGDPKQMPPPNTINKLFDSVVSNTNTFSILDAAEAAKLPKVVLTHHYRSRHPTLIHGSNRLFYEARLRQFPTPFPSANLGLKIQRVAGQYDRRATQTNLKEAEAIVAELKHHIETGSTQSVMIIAVSEPQRECIARLVEAAGLDTSSITEKESLLITSSDFVQGEERDIVLVSLTFGPDGKSRATSFGPLSLPGGDKRLNVMMTRARDRTKIFSSVDSKDITRGINAGQNTLISYLALAERGLRSIAIPYTGPLDELLARGKWTGERYGNAIALKDATGRYIASIYVRTDAHSGTEASEIFQLRNMGWKVSEITAEKAALCEANVSAGEDLLEEINEHRVSP